MSPHLGGCKKGHSTHYILFSLLKNWKNTIDKTTDGNSFVEEVLTDLRFWFDVHKNELLISKLYAYGFSKESIMLPLSYLSSCWWQKPQIKLHLVPRTSYLRVSHKNNCRLKNILTIYLSSWNVVIVIFAEYFISFVCQSCFFLNELVCNPNVFIS